MLPNPPEEAQREIAEKLRLALSSSETGKAALQAKYEEVQAAATQLKGQIELVDHQVKEKETTLGDKNRALNGKVGELAQKSAEVDIKAKQAERESP